jgi:hypothetical protein
LSQTAAWSGRTTEAHQNSHTLDVSAQKGGTGSLYGRIMVLDDKNKDVPAKYFSVHAHGNLDYSETKTDSDGYFVTREMSGGQYAIFVVAKDGYQQKTEAVGTVIVGKKNAVYPNPILMIRNK